MRFRMKATFAGADPEFPVGGITDPLLGEGGGRGRQHTILSNVPKKLHEIKKILDRGGAPPWIRH